MSNVRPVPPMPPGGGAPMNEAPGGGAPPAPGVDSPFPGMDMSDPIVAYFMGNLDEVNDQDIAVLAGMSPQMAAVLTQIMPELGPVWELFGSSAPAPSVAQMQAGGDGGNESPPMAAPDQPPPPAQRRPTSGLSNF